MTERTEAARGGGVAICPHCDGPTDVGELDGIEVAYCVAGPDRDGCGWHKSRGGPMPDRLCPVCGNPVDAPPPEAICNPHSCPSWEVTHVYDRKTRTWVPEVRSDG